MTYEKIQEVNSEIAPTKLEKTSKKTGKTAVIDYVAVNERVKAFRKLYPDGCIETDIISANAGSVTMKTFVRDGDRLLATGIAHEYEDASYINRTSYMENCETSAVGRALGFLGIGIDTSICSADELQNALNKQSKETEIGGATQKPAAKNEHRSSGVTAQQLEVIKALPQEDVKQAAEALGFDTLKGISFDDAAKVIKAARWLGGKSDGI